MKKFTLIMFCTLFILIAKAQYNNNYSANFNGTTAYLKLPQTTGDMDFRDYITVEFWMKPKAYPASGKLASLFQKTNPANGNGVQITMDNEGSVGFFINNDYYTAPAAAVIGFWTHVAVIYDKVNLRIYFNGAEVFTQPLAAGEFYQPYAAYIGAAFYANGIASDFYNGEIDELRVWNFPRSKYDIDNYCHQSFTGMGIAYKDLRISLPFNNNFTDQGGKEYNTVINNKVTFINYTNKNATYLSYNSSLYDNANTFTVSPHADLDATSAITTEFWGRLNGSTDLLLLKGNALINYRISYGYKAPAYYVSFLCDGQSGTQLISKNIPDSLKINGYAWNHIAVTYKASTERLRFYFNGKVFFDTVITGTGSLKPTTEPLLVRTTNGYFDEIRIWKNIERSSAQIKADMFKGYNYTMSPLPSNVTVFDFDGRMDDVMKPIADSAKMLHLTNGDPVFYKTYDHFGKVISNSDRLTAPLLRDEKNFFNDITKYTSSAKRFVITYPQSGSITDSVLVSANGTISDMKVYVFADVINYTSLKSGISQNIKLTLISPHGKRVQLTPNFNSTYIGDNMYCVFDMNAGKKIDYTGANVIPPYSPSVKPYQSFTKLSGVQEHGWWKLQLEVPGASANVDVELLGWGIYPIIDSSSALNADVSENLKTDPGFAGVSAFPNPFIQSINISYTLQKQSDVHISLIDANGKMIAAILNKEDDVAGTHNINFNGSKLSAGVYFCRIETAEKVQTIKIVKQ